MGVPRHLLLVFPGVRFEGRVRHYMADYSSSTTPANFVFPPMELLYTAALARDRGLRVSLLDAAAEGRPPEWVLERAVALRPTHILMPAPLGRVLPALFPLLEALDHRLPGARQAVYGAEVTRDPGHLLHETPVDAAILGEPDVPAVDWALGVDPADNVVRRSGPPGGELVPLMDLDGLPHPARDLLDPRRYYSPLAREGPFTAVWASRGCSHGLCRFCPSALWRPAGQLARHSPAWVVEDIARALALGYREIIFRDQTFTSDPAWVTGICEGMLSAGLRVGWRCMTRVDAVDREILATMRRAGCTQISFGIEASEQAALDATGKGTSVDQAREACRLAREVGLEVIGNFLVGLEGQSRRGMLGISRYAREIGCDYAQFHTLFPNPGSPGYGDAGLAPRPSGLQLGAERLAYLDFYLSRDFLWRKRSVLLRPRILRALLSSGWTVLRHGT